MNFENKTGIKGQFQINVKDENGALLREYPVQDNLILNNLIKIMLGKVASDSLGYNNSNAFDAMFVGTSSTEPVVTNTKLGACVGQSSTFITSSVNKNVVEKSNLFEITTVYKGVILNLNNQNITELGLGYLVTGSINVNGDNSNARYVLYTHALIRDKQGVPTTITVRQGEILEITYTLKVSYDIGWKTGTITLVDEDNNSNSKNFKWVGRLFVPNSGNSNGLVFRSHRFMDSSYYSSINLYHGANDERTNTFEKMFNVLKTKFPLNSTSPTISVGNGTNYDPATWGLMDKIPNRNSYVEGDNISSLTLISAVDVLSNWNMNKDSCAAIVVPTGDNKGNTTHYWFSPYNGNSAEFINGIRQVSLYFFMGDNKSYYSVFFIDDTGKGIMKNDTQLLKMSFTNKIERM